MYLIDEESSAFDDEPSFLKVTSQDYDFLLKSDLPKI